MPDTPVTLHQLREAVTYEVRQQMTAYVLQSGQHHEDLRLLKWTVFGNQEAGEKGLVRSYQDISSTLQRLVDDGKQRKWLQNGIAIGVGLQFLSTTGVLDWIIHLVKTIP